VVERDLHEFPSPQRLAELLDAPTDIQTVPVPADCSDGFLLSFWSRPEAVLDPAARAATSGFARLDDEVEAAAVERLRHDFQTGAWDAEHGDLRSLAQLDVGLRLFVSSVDAD